MGSSLATPKHRGSEIRGAEDAMRVQSMQGTGSFKDTLTVKDVGSLNIPVMVELKSGEKPRKRHVPVLPDDEGDGRTQQGGGGAVAASAALAQQLGARMDRMEATL